MAISKYGSINEDGDSNDRENREVRSNHIHVEESQRYSNLRQAIAGNIFSVAKAILEIALSVSNTLSSIDFNQHTTLITNQL